MPFHLLPNQTTTAERKASRRASESAALLGSFSGSRSGIKEMLQSSLSTTSNQQQPPPSIVINDIAGSRPRASSLSLLKKKLSTSVTKNSSGGGELMTRGRSMSNELNATTSNISMAPTDVASIISSNYEAHVHDSQRYEKPNKLLVQYLKTQGLSEPSKLLMLSTKQQHRIFNRKQPHNGFEVFVSNNGNMLLLPYVSSKKFSRTVSEEDDGDEENDNEDDDLNEDYESNNSNENRNSSSSLNNSSALNRINHTFSVILKLDRKQTLNPIVKLKFSSDCNIEWVNGIPDSKDQKKTIYNENYKISKDLVWDLHLDHTDCYIPFEDDDTHAEENDQEDFTFMEDSESSNTNNTDHDNLVVSSTPSQELKKLEAFSHKERAHIDMDSLDLDNEYHLTNGEAKRFEPGYYVFLLPVLFPPTMPESIISPLGKISYALTIKAQPVIGADLKPPQQALFSTSPLLNSKFYSTPLQPMSSPPTSPNLSPYSSGTTNKFLKSLKHVGEKKKDENVKEFQVELPVIRQPPPDSVTTINKSVYVNKIWNEALNYEITFPKKYVSMSSIDEDIVNNFDLKIKIMPLVKKIYMKRIRVNMIEKITYASRDLRYEYDFGKEFAIDKGIRERIIPLFEIKTKEKSHSKSHSLRSEVVKNCLDDNLLTTCYNDYRPSKRRDPNANDEDDIAVTNTVKVSCPLTFYIKNDELVKNIRSNITGGSSVLSGYDDSDVESITSVDSKHISPTSSFINMLSKSPASSAQQHQQQRDDLNQQLKDKFGLYPDVSGFGNINIKHRLQICFRISKLENPETLKPNDDPNKLHHYEVIIDTPIILNSPFANDHTPPSYSEVLMNNLDDSHFQIKPVYLDHGEFDIDDDDDQPPPPPFEFNVGSPISGGYDIQSEFNSNEELITPYSMSVEDSHSPTRQYSRQPSIASSRSRSRNASISAAPGFSTIDELLVLENSSMNQSNLSKLLSTSNNNNNFDNLPAPPEYSKLDTNPVNNDGDEFDIGGENFQNEDEIENHDEYNKKRIESAKRENHVLMKKVEDDLADFSF